MVVLNHILSYELDQPKDFDDGAAEFVSGLSLLLPVDAAGGQDVVHLFELKRPQ